VLSLLFSSVSEFTLKNFARMQRVDGSGQPGGRVPVWAASDFFAGFVLAALLRRSRSCEIKTARCADRRPLLSENQLNTAAQIAPGGRHTQEGEVAGVCFGSCRLHFQAIPRAGHGFAGRQRRAGAHHQTYAGRQAREFRHGAQAHARLFEPTTSAGSRRRERKAKENMSLRSACSTLFVLPPQGFCVTNGCFNCLLILWF
jgi:hypothetical protein